jgi:maleylacetate reductase
MSMTFEHINLGQRVLFGAGLAAPHVAESVARHGATRVMAIASRPKIGMAREVLADTDVALWFTDVIQHVPLANAESARAAARAHRIDLMVSVGGGSTTGLAKAIALTTGIPIIAVPTTYAGSEATNMWGITDDRTKTTGIDNKVLPETVVYDAELTKSLPVKLSIASGLNALAHCVDSLWAPQADPINQALALEGARALAQALPALASEPDTLEGREKALYGCYLAGVAFTSAGSGLHHKICHVLGGTFGLPHAETHAVILRYVLALNAPAVPELAGRLADALGTPLSAANDPAVDAITALNDLYAQLKSLGCLADYGFSEADVPEATTRIIEVAPASNPVKVTQENITALLSDALYGATPNFPVSTASELQLGASGRIEIQHAAIDLGRTTHAEFGISDRRAKA